MSQMLWRPDPALPPVPEWMRSALERCLHDLQQPEVVPLRIGSSRDGAGLQITEDGERGAFVWTPVVNREWIEDVVYALADVLQEQVFPETRAAWGEARPACPGHPHPAAVMLEDDGAFWMCPVDGRILARIGEY